MISLIVVLAIALSIALGYKTKINGSSLDCVGKMSA